MADSWKQTVGALEEGEIFTKDAPGKWAGKEGGHTPVCTKNDDGSYDTHLELLNILISRIKLRLIDIFNKIVELRDNLLEEKKKNSHLHKL